MLKRVATWLAGLAFIAELREFVKTRTETAEYEKFTLPLQQGKFTLPWQKQKAMFPVQERVVMVARQAKSALPWQKQRRFTLPWQKQRKFMLPKQVKFTLPKQVNVVLPWQQRRASRMKSLRPLLIGFGIGAGLMYVFYTLMTKRRANGGETGYTGLAMQNTYGGAGRELQGQGGDFGSPGRHGSGQQGAGFGTGQGTDFERVRPGQAYRAQPQTSSQTTSQSSSYRDAGTHFGDRSGAVTGSHTEDRTSAVTGGAAPMGERQGETLANLSRETTGQFDWHDGGDVPREQWQQFCENFGQQHAGRRVTVVAQHPDGSESTISTSQPLITLSNEQHDGAFDLRLVLGDDVNEQLAHNVTNVESLRVQHGGMGAEELHVRSADGMTTVRFE